MKIFFKILAILLVTGLLAAAIFFAFNGPGHAPPSDSRPPQRINGGLRDQGGPIDGFFEILGTLVKIGGITALVVIGGKLTQLLRQPAGGADKKDDHLL